MYFERWSSTGGGGQISAAVSLALYTLLEPFITVSLVHSSIMLIVSEIFSFRKCEFYDRIFKTAKVYIHMNKSKS